MNGAQRLHIPAQIALAALVAVWLCPGSGRPSGGDA